MRATRIDNPLLGTMLAMPVASLRALMPLLTVPAMVEQTSAPAKCPSCDLIEGVAVIAVTGLLVQKPGATGPVLVEGIGTVTGYDGIRASLALALADDAVRAIVLDVDSNGGQTAGSLDLADLVHAARALKPIWAILSESACGTAYLLASACDVVTVPRTGRTGGLGVVVAHLECSRALTMAGLAVTLITSGERKADGNEFQPLSNRAHAHIQADVDVVGELFVATVARNRGLRRADVRRLEGATLLGTQGVEAGLADVVMSPDAAVHALLHSLNNSAVGLAQPGITANRSPRKRAPGNAWAALAYRQEIRNALR
ncbi:S49 family peptidase [Paraburkholderia sabiae]|uniref:S49 family peptidase n=1 Tax=Paraburkholderia sabiae TaxID=273251 RepID=A0ABU9Q8D8_9BURK|nr:S49 family peptidase [Paraburkholderia sabiae]WJZ77704.1 S49 family peptidase [Paraburkholderia sabiae]CAD6533062.1 hypothetical protein LMG24235_02702 [Paraburkholderia sabiae]